MSSSSAGEIGVSLRTGCVDAGALAAGAVVAAALGANAVAQASLALEVDQVAQVNLTAAQVKALNTTPITLIAAPGATSMILVKEVLATMVYGTATYSCNAGGFDIKYKSDASGAACGAVLTQAFVQAGSGTNFAHVRGSATLITDVTANLANQPVVIQAHTSDPTTGDSIIKVKIYYRVVAVPLT